ncbi:MAG: type II toxin-antitoxin system HicB family antitoxin [Thermodesulfobacteriota bacterium]
MPAISATSTARKKFQRSPQITWSNWLYEQANVSRMRSMGPSEITFFSVTGARIMNESNWIINETQPDINSFEIEITKDIPYELIQKYKKIAVKTAKVKKLDDGTWYAELPGFPGVWATDETSKENALIALEEVLEDWIVIKIEVNDRDIPIVDGIDLN